MDTKSRTIAAGDFKQGCLALIDEVAEQCIEVVITKRGRPMARLVPVESDEERERSVLAALRGQGSMLVSEEEFVAPTTHEAGWELDNDH